jgi:transposase
MDQGETDMTDEKARLEKNARIKAARLETGKRRTSQACRVFELKISQNKLSKAQKEHLTRMFLEGKWVWNHALADRNNGIETDTKLTKVTVKTPAGPEERDIRVLGSQMKQDIIQSIDHAVRGLAAKKKKGYKVGKIKFRKYCDSVPLRQYGTTYRIDFKRNTVSIQNMKKPMRTGGLSQIPSDAEIANAVLVRKSDGYYVHVTTYSAPNKEVPFRLPAVGIDMGIKTGVTLSDGRKFSAEFPEDDKVKKHARRLSRMYARNGKEKTQNFKKEQAKLNKAYQKLGNKKEDAANKLVASLLDEFDTVVFQDEMIRNWHKGLFGRKVQYGILGRVKAKLKKSSRSVMTGRSFPSTQICPECGKNTRHELSKRHYLCDHCGYFHPDRDVKAAQSILEEGMKTRCGAQRAPCG